MQAKPPHSFNWFKWHRCSRSASPVVPVQTEPAAPAAVAWPVPRPDASESRTNETLTRNRLRFTFSLRPHHRRRNTLPDPSIVPMSASFCSNLPKNSCSLTIIIQLTVGRPPPPEESPWRCQRAADTRAHGCPIPAPELVGQGEDHVEVGHRQEVGLTFGQPGCPLTSTALRTASVAARMIVVSNLAAVIALGNVPAQGGCAAERQVLKRLPHVGALGPTLEELGSILPHELTQG